jgi:hypothetical protein
MTQAVLERPSTPQKGTDLASLFVVHAEGDDTLWDIMNPREERDAVPGQDDNAPSQENKPHIP